MFFKSALVKAVFTSTVFEILLFEGRSDYHPPSGVQGAKGVTGQIPFAKWKLQPTAQINKTVATK